MAVVVENGDAVPHAGELEAALDAGEAGERGADIGVGDACLGCHRNRGERVERVVLPEQRQRPAAQRALPALHARAQLGVEDGRAPVEAHAREDEVGVVGRAVGQEPATVAAQVQPLDHVAHHRMIDAGHAQAVERDVAIEGLELAVHVLDRLEVVEVLRIDVGDDADLARQAR